ncbi:hypothetical protein ABPG75_007548 [Micractinium tetrahymenae]
MQLTVSLQSAGPAAPGAPPLLPEPSAEVEVELRSAHFQRQRRRLPLRVRPGSGGSQRLGAPTLTFSLVSAAAAGGPATPVGSCACNESGSLAFPRECEAQLAASELRFSLYVQPASSGGGGGGEERQPVCMGSITLAEAAPNGQPMSVAVKMRRGDCAVKGELAGRLQVELRLRLPRQRSRGRSRSGDGGSEPALPGGFGSGPISGFGSGGAGLSSYGSGGTSLTTSASAPRTPTAAAPNRGK